MYEILIRQLRAKKAANQGKKKARCRCDAKGAGKRSGVRRSAKRALVLKKKWLDLILAGQKKCIDQNVPVLAFAGAEEWHSDALQGLATSWCTYYGVSLVLNAAMGLDLPTSRYYIWKRHFK